MRGHAQSNHECNTAYACALMLPLLMAVIRYVTNRVAARMTLCKAVVHGIQLQAVGQTTALLCGSVSHKLEMGSNLHIALLPCERGLHKGNEHHIPRALEDKAYLMNRILIWVG